MKQSHFPMFMVWFASCNLFAQADCDGERYRFTSANSNVSVSYDHAYGSNTNVYGVEEELVFDFYEAAGSTEAHRPLLIMAHGGFFLSGSNDGVDVVPLCEDLARMGYAVASISYRLGVVNLLDLENELVRAVWRGVHDSRAAVRYFRRSVEEEGNPWAIDADRIFIGGVSAGGFIALHHAYVDEESEIPASIDQAALGLGGGLEGLSGNSGFGSEVAGVFNICGALKDASWIAAGDEPLVSVHGTNDATVPFGADLVSLMGFPVTEVDGSSVIHEQAEAVGLTHCFVPIEGADHVPHVLDMHLNAARMILRPN
jgi:para-nitrobenzyl esterase